MEKIDKARKVAEAMILESGKPMDTERLARRLAKDMTDRQLDLVAKRHGIPTK